MDIVLTSGGNAALANRLRELRLIDKEESNMASVNSDEWRALYATIVILTGASCISGETERAATYCHSTLQRQLQLNHFSPMEWALNAATLSQYYITKGLYMEGRHCLSAATVITGLAGEAPSEAAAQESEAESERREQLRQKRAEIARCWIKYCLNLLQDSKKLLEDSIGELDTDRQEEMKMARRREEEEEEKGRKSALLFGSEDTFDSIASLEEKVRCSLPLDFTEARVVFLVGQNYVTQAKEYFEMDGHVTDHVEILQDHSALFRSNNNNESINLYVCIHLALKV
uniref:KIF-binding protein-like n=1 Tax=Gasterosteus aculeatus aculeatus TaxID=481459 RepID=UPI001A99C5CB|nr:KIF-binding protein-like [Gasterosteus aculeatus aculeatus]